MAKKKRKRNPTRCEHCDKRKFKTDLEAIGAALWASRLWGKPMRIYPCPQNAKALHLTSQRRNVNPWVVAPGNA